MPLYDYLCTGCGSFEAHADVSLASVGMSCPSCSAPATRLFSSPGGRVPRRQRQLEGLGGAALRRVDRAQAGAPSAGAMPAGTQLDRSGKPRLPATGADHRRPWQLGH